MAFADIITNTVAVLVAAGFERNDPRHTLEEECDAGKDRRFTVEATPVVETLFLHAIPDNARTALLKVRLGFFAGGGDAGGAEHGGDMVSVNARAFDESTAVAALLESPLRYNAQATGIRRQNLRGWDKASTARRSEVWEVLLDVEWEQAQKPQAVPA
jgi:hypothetical protein